MDNAILPRFTDTIYEPHISLNQKLPFIFHNIFYEIHQKTGRCNIHEGLELLYFIDGSGCVRYDDTVYSVQKDDIIIVNSYVHHQVIPQNNLHFICLIVDNRFFKVNHMEVTTLNFSPAIQDEYAAHLFHMVAEEYISLKDFHEIGVNCAVSNLLLYLCRNYCSIRTEPLQVDNPAFNLIRHATDYIKKNLAKKITLEGIAANAGFSKYHFAREFKRVTGYTLIEYVNIMRCEYAQELLSSQSLTIKEISLLCGFHNSSYFANVYKKYIGVLPSEC